MKHLRFCLMTAFEAGETRHAQSVMLELGITYRYAVPQSMGDQWWFLDCDGVPDELPVFLTYMNDFDPQGCVGYGLTPAMADALTVA